MSQSISILRFMDLDVEVDVEVDMNRDMDLAEKDLSKYRKAKIFSIRSIRYQNKKLTMLESVQVPERGNAVLHFPVRNQIEAMDAGMKIPELTFSMPLLSYGNNWSSDLKQAHAMVPF
jgi:hypothetical protein